MVGLSQEYDLVSKFESADGVFELDFVLDLLVFETSDDTSAAFHDEAIANCEY